MDGNGKATRGPTGRLVSLSANGDNHDHCRVHQLSMSILLGSKGRAAEVD